MALDLRLKAGIAVVLGLITLGGLICWMWGDQAVAVMDYVGSERIHPSVFIVLFVLLPIIGFPISPFLILIGMYGAVYLLRRRYQGFGKKGDGSQ